jgi:hypothetical protein
MAIADGTAKIIPGIRATGIRKADKKDKIIPDPISPHSPSIASHIPEIIPPRRFSIIMGTERIVSDPTKPEVNFVLILLMYFANNYFLATQKAQTGRSRSFSYQFPDMASEATPLGLFMLHWTLKSCHFCGLGSCRHYLLAIKL